MTPKKAADARRGFPVLLVRLSLHSVRKAVRLCAFTTQPGEALEGNRRPRAELRLLHGLDDDGAAFSFWHLNEDGGGEGDNDSGDLDVIDGLAKGECGDDDGKYRF